MYKWSFTLQGPGGILSTLESGETQFVLGTEQAADVWTIAGEGVAARHALVRVAAGRLQVEDLAGGTLVNGHPIRGRVEAEYPASVQVGEVTLVVEQKSEDPSQAATIVQSPRQGGAPFDDLEMTVVTPRAVATPQHVSVESANKAATLCEYTLVKEIARGGMGQIYFGEDPQLRRQVAVKVSSVSYGGEDPRFSKEAEVLARLAHPNIVPIHTMGVDAQGRPFYAMKLVKGRTLQAVLNALREGNAETTKDYTQAALLTIFRKVCDAMAFAHAKGILHRDLKPENIMVGEYGEVLVMDWGLAKILGERDAIGEVKAAATDTGDYGMTLEGEVMGTPQYMSPEQAEGMVAELDIRSDIYSLGGILYAILTLRPPVGGSTLAEVLGNVKSGVLSPMGTATRMAKGIGGRPEPMTVAVPAALQAVTLKAMATHRNHRYPSVGAFAADIEAYQNGFATSAENAGTLRQLALFIKRNKGIAAAVAVFTVAAAVFVVKLAASERRARAEMERSRREAAQSQIFLAESAYAQSDGAQMRLALSKVPEDLRTQVWRYLDERTVGGDVGVFPEGDTTWMGLEPNPLQSGSFFSIRSDGAFCRIEGLTGAVSVLWKADVSADRMGQFSVSKDGVLTAFSAKERTPQGEVQIQIRRVTDGGHLRTCVLPKGRGVHSRLWISEDYLLAQTFDGKKQQGFFTAWSVADGRLLWERQETFWKTFASFSEDPKEISLISGEGILQRVEAVSGKVLVKSKNRIGGMPNRWENYDGGREWKRFAMATGVAGQVRVYSDAWNDLLHTEFVSSNPVNALAFLPDTDLLLAVCVASDQAGCLEIRDCSQGARLVRSLPFTEGRFYWDAVTSLRCSGAFAAFLLPNHIRIWNCSESTPVRNSIHLSGRQLVGTMLSPNGLEVIGYRMNTEPQPKVNEICFFSTRDGWDSPKETGKLLIPPAKPGAAPALRGGFADGSLEVQFSPDGRRAIFQSFASCLALNIESGVLKNTWGAEKVLLPYASGHQRMLIHPQADLLWTGDAVVAFSTGAEVKRMNRGRFSGYQRFPRRRAAWIGASRVVEECRVVLKSEGGSVTSASNWLVLWDTQTGEPLAEELSPDGSCLSISPDGSSIAEGCNDNRVRFRNPKTLAVEREFRVHESGVRNIDWHPTLPIMATLGANEVRLWDVKEGRMLEEIRLRREAHHMRFVANGRQLQVSGTLFEPKSCAP